MINILPHEKIDVLSKYRDLIDELEVIKFTGTVERIVGLTIESVGPSVRYGIFVKLKPVRVSIFMRK